ncbi:hypothetical protein [Salinibacterium sp.]|uniref:hypothetical protein n=1 Tax=Salinibacterium sp. TaxID=1915057 RepID=UPI00286B5D03|nr:hypothetical protein [Salinibacterium sp.]
MRAPTSIAAVALAVLLLSGCVPQQSTNTPTPEPSSTPVFASEEEALAAATAAYAAYLAVSDQIGADGGANPERLEPLVTAEWLTKEIGVYEKFALTKNSLQGSTTFRESKLQRLSEESGGEAEVVIYTCTDFSATRFIDAVGADVTPVDRQTTAGLEIAFVIEDGDSARLFLAGSEPWSTDALC